MTSATDEPRRLLDELRKLACDINEEEIRSHSVITLNQGRYNRQFRLDMNHDWLNAWHAELERILQAIAATLGDSVATGERQGVVWQCVLYDDLTDYPYADGYVYRRREDAKKRAKRMTYVDDGVRHWATVRKLITCWEVDE